MTLRKYEVFYVPKYDDDLGHHQALFDLGEGKQAVSIQRSDPPPIATYDFSDEDHEIMLATPGVTYLPDD